jgi:hypothetical protein
VGGILVGSSRAMARMGQVAMNAIVAKRVVKRHAMVEIPGRIIASSYKSVRNK